MPIFNNMCNFAFKLVHIVILVQCVNFLSSFNMQDVTCVEGAKVRFFNVRLKSESSPCEDLLLSMVKTEE